MFTNTVRRPGHRRRRTGERASNRLTTHRNCKETFGLVLVPMNTTTSPGFTTPVLDREHEFCCTHYLLPCLWDRPLSFPKVEEPPAMDSGQRIALPQSGIDAVALHIFRFSLA